eukprot:13118890-Alexandrium_andersonii.AAC.1
MGRWTAPNAADVVKAMQQRACTHTCVFARTCARARPAGACARTRACGDALEGACACVRALAG